MANIAGFSVHLATPPPPPLPSALETEARAVAASDACVLLLGERGTGKTELARRIHEWSPRSAGPFVRVDLAATPSELIHSELFGHTKGAFTGAEKERDGMVQCGDGGSVFLDEISALGPQAQGNLLTLLQERRVRALGSDRWTRVDARMICATNQGLRDMASRVRFRPDLYDRCTRAMLRIPSLRERREEFPAIARRVFWTVLNTERPRGLRKAIVSPGALASLFCYAFPGNLRELETVAYRALLAAEDGFVRRRHVRAALDDQMQVALGVSEFQNGHEAPSIPSRYHRLSEPADERDCILRALTRTAGNKRQAAKRLGMSRRTLYRKLDGHAIDDDEWREAEG